MVRPKKLVCVPTRKERACEFGYSFRRRVRFRYTDNIIVIEQRRELSTFVGGL